MLRQDIASHTRLESAVTDFFQSCEIAEAVDLLSLSNAAYLSGPIHMDAFQVNNAAFINSRMIVLLVQLREAWVCAQKEVTHA